MTRDKFPAPGPTMPNGWGQDFLTKHFHAAHENRYATVANLTPQCDELAAIDEALRSYWPTLREPQPQASATLLVRAHLLFANVCEMAYSTQVFASAVLARTALEAAGYASLIAIDPEAEKKWHDRDRSPSSKDKTIKYFSRTRIRDALISHHVELASTYQRLYDAVIDFGAHPNIAGISLNSNDRPTEQGWLIEQLALTGDVGLIEFGLKIAFDVGLFVAGTTIHVLDAQDSTKELKETVVKIMESHNARLTQSGQQATS